VPLCTPNPNQRGCMMAGAVHGPGCPKPGKTPLVKWREYQDRVPTAAEVAGWRKQWPAANWSLPTGRSSGVALLDDDDGIELDLPPTVTVRTGRPGGRHHYVAYPEGAPLKNATGFLPGWDFRGEGGLLILPGSVHPSGNRYAIDTATLAHGFAELPSDIRNGLKAAPGRAASAGPAISSTTLLAGIPEGQRDITLFRLACKLRAADVPESAAVEVVRWEARRCQPPFDEAQAAEKVQRAYSTYPAGRGETSTVACEAALDQAQAENAELRAKCADLEQALDVAERRLPEQFVERLIDQIVELEKDPSTRGLALPMLVLLKEHGAATGKWRHTITNPETPPAIPWRGDERGAQLGRAPNTLRKVLDYAEDHGIIASEYKDLGDRKQGDWRRERHLRLVADLPDDLPDALYTIRRRCHERREPRERPKRSRPCEACGTAQCTEPDCEAPVQKVVEIRCTAHQTVVVPAHVHHPHRPSARPRPAVLHLRYPAPPESERKNCAPTSTNYVGRKNCVPNLPNETAVETAVATLDRLLNADELAALSPADALAYKLEALRVAAAAARAAPTDLDAPDEDLPELGGHYRLEEDACDTCGGPLAAGDCLRCSACARAS